MTTPKRLSLWESIKTDPIRAHWLFALIGADAAGAVLCMLDDDRASLLATTPYWGGLLAGAVGLILSGCYILGGIAGTFGWGALVDISWSTISDLHAAPVFYLIPAVFGWATTCHILVVYDVGTGLDWVRERKQRRG